MVCRLCATSEDLCRSHIQPEFHYQPLYDEKHWFSILIKGIEEKALVNTDSLKLLCRAYEQHLCKYGKCAAEIVCGKTQSPCYAAWQFHDDQRH